MYLVLYRVNTYTIYLHARINAQNHGFSSNTFHSQARIPSSYHRSLGKLVMGIQLVSYFIISFFAKYEQ